MPTSPHAHRFGRLVAVCLAAACLAGGSRFADPAGAAEWSTADVVSTTAIEEIADVGPDAVVGFVSPKTIQEELSSIVLAAAAKDACADENEGCTKALKKLRDDQLAAIDLDIRVGGRPGNDYPCECRLEGEAFKPRRFACTTLTWKAAGYCHKPLYFEHWNLERYGHSHGPWLDPFFSAAHFFVRVPLLPYQMGVELPWECVYPLGYYRPGDCAPWTCPAVPISVRGMAVQAATVTGIVFLLP